MERRDVLPGQIPLLSMRGGWHDEQGFEGLVSPHVQSMTGTTGKVSRAWRPSR